MFPDRFSREGEGTHNHIIKRLTIDYRERPLFQEILMIEMLNDVKWCLLETISSFSHTPLAHFQIVLKAEALFFGRGDSNFHLGGTLAPLRPIKEKTGYATGLHTSSLKSWDP